MRTHRVKTPAGLGPAYAVLRLGGDAPARALSRLGLEAGTAPRLECRFRASARRGDDQPRFARDESHVRAVLREGGYPVMPS